MLRAEAIRKAGSNTFFSASRAFIIPKSTMPLKANKAFSAASLCVPPNWAINPSKATSPPILPAALIAANATSSSAALIWAATALTWDATWFVPNQFKISAFTEASVLPCNILATVAYQASSAMLSDKRKAFTRYARSSPFIAADTNGSAFLPATATITSKAAPFTWLLSVAFNKTLAAAPASLPRPSPTNFWSKRK